MQGGIVLWPSQRPLEASPFFRFLSSANAPPSTGAILLVGSQRDLSGTRVLGMRLYIGLGAALVLLPTTTNANGVAAAPLPLPQGTRGLGIHAQLAFVNTPSCKGPGLLSSTDALSIRVR